MVRKNDSSVIQQQTALGFESLASSESSYPSVQTIIKALDIVCKLSGIGPATGTLILNLYDPVNIPFFQDELFAWIFPESKGSKLKYTQKEYRQLIEATHPVLQRLKVTALELEKVSYVLGHTNILDQEAKQQLNEALGQNSSTKDEQEMALKSSTGKSTFTPQGNDIQKPRKRPIENTSSAGPEQPSKRRSQRGK